MELIIIIGIVAVFFWLRKRRKTKGLDAEFASRVDVDERSLKDPDSDWIEMTFQTTPNRRRPKWVILPDGADLSVRGTSYRLKQAKSFLGASKNDESFLSLDRTEVHGETAIRVLGHIDDDPGEEPFFLGYVPKQSVEEIETTYDETMPIEARLKRAAIKKDGKAVSIKFDLIGPNKKKREAYLL